jgi:hypothetical protein
MAPGTGEAINFIPDNVKNKCHVVDPGVMDQVRPSWVRERGEGCIGPSP